MRQPYISNHWISNSLKYVILEIGDSHLQITALNFKIRSLQDSLLKIWYTTDVTLRLASMFITQNSKNALKKYNFQKRNSGPCKLYEYRYFDLDSERTRDKNEFFYTFFRQRNKNCVVCVIGLVRHCLLVHFWKIFYVFSNALTIRLR